MSLYVFDDNLKRKATLTLTTTFRNMPKTSTVNFILLGYVFTFEFPLPISLAGNQKYCQLIKKTNQLQSQLKLLREHFENRTHFQDHTSSIYIISTWRHSPWHSTNSQKQLVIFSQIKYLHLRDQKKSRFRWKNIICTTFGVAGG